MRLIHLWVLLPFASSPLAQDSGVLEKVCRELGVRALRPIEVQLPADDPDAFAVELEWEGTRHVAWLERHSLRSARAGLRLVGSGGTRTELPLPAPTTFRGRLLTDPASTVLASRTPHGLRADVLSGGERLWAVRPVQEVLPRIGIGRHVAYRASDEIEEPLRCGLEAEPIGSPQGGFVDSDPLGLVPDCLQLAEIAFDADFEYFQARGSVANTIATIDAHMNLVDFYYARDARITYDITWYVIRTAPFYNPTSGGNLLDQFRAEWNTNQTDVVRDMAHLMTAKPGNLIEFGGLAWVGVVCTNLAYGWSLDSAGIIGHEVGHNWNAPHCLDPTPCNNMCGACLNIGPVTRGVILAHRDSRNCLEASESYGDPLPPFAAPDRRDLKKREFENLGPQVLDVVANDDDGNCDRVRIEGFDPVSDRGGTVALSPGTGPAGRDELIYTLPTEPFVGEDTFSYLSGDGTGQQSTGTVTIDLIPTEITGYWSLDEGSGSLAADSAPAGNDGQVGGNPVWTSGNYGSALEFDGSGDAVTIDPLHLNTDRLTITAWVRRNGAQTPFAGIVFSRDASTVAGLNFTSTGALGYHWNNAANTWSWGSGLVLPNATWALVALVVEPHQATIYLHDGTLQSSVNPVSHGIEEFDGQTRLGWNPPTANRCLDGALDDVRFYTQCLSADEIEELWNEGGRAEGPLPVDGGKLIDPQGVLTWIASPVAVEHDVYLGTSYVAVRDATPASPEYQGSQTGTSYAPSGLAPDTTYYWRVDEDTGSSTVKGSLWQFSLADFHHWELDETSGSVAVDSQGGANGDYLDGPSLNQPGATPGLGTSVAFDGNNDRVRIHDLDLHSNRVTITTWLERDGNQDPFAGLIFNRDVSTTAGLNFGNANELRYHWNGAGDTWGWDSGLVVPDQTWVFCALVVEPNQATMYLGDGGGVLSSAVNAVSHGIEEWDGRTFLGRDSAGGRYFQGKLDDARIYDASLTPGQVDQLYQDSLLRRTGGVPDARPSRR